MYIKLCTYAYIYVYIYIYCSFYSLSGLRTVTLDEKELPLSPTSLIPSYDVPAMAVIWVMLGVLPVQEELEQRWASRIATIKSEFSISPTLAPASVANLCLLLFTGQTGVAVTMKKMSYSVKTLTITVEQAANKVIIYHYLFYYNY